MDKDGGRKQLIDSVATPDENFRTLLAKFTEGTGMRQVVLSTNLSRREISRCFVVMGKAASSHLYTRCSKSTACASARHAKKIDGRAS